MLEIRQYKCCLIIFLIIAFLSSLAGCNKPVEISSASSPPKSHFWFQSTPDCKAPCWQGLYPGISTTEDVKAMIATLPTEEIEDLECILYESGKETCIWGNKYPDYLVNLVLFDGILGYMRFVSTTGMVPLKSIYTNDEGEIVVELEEPSPDDPQSTNVEKKVMLKEVFDNIGEPDKYFAEHFSGRHGEHLIELNFFYQNGVIIHYILSNAAVSEISREQCQMQISPESFVAGDIYFSQPAISEEEIYNNPYAPRLTKGALQDWQGVEAINLCP